MTSAASSESLSSNHEIKLNMPGRAKKIVVCVFCGSSPGKSASHMAAARSLAEELHKNDISLVYGGGTVGLMGEVARNLVSLSGPDSVHGVIPAALVGLEGKFDPAKPNQNINKTIDNTIYGQTTVVRDMHERKALMAREVTSGAPGSGFVALSGGYGTMEELMEVTTWNQLGIHDKPVVLHNVDGYWDGIIQWVSTAVDAGFVSPGNRSILAEARTAEEVVDRLKNYQNAAGRLNLKWERNGAN